MIAPGLRFLIDAGTTSRRRTSDQMKGITMNKLFVLAPLALLGLAACSTGNIVQSMGDARISGTMKQGLQAHVAEITLNGKVYRGEWVSEGPTPEQKESISYPHKKHVSQLTINLKADDGNAMVCKGLAHGLAGDLLCTAGGKEYPVTLK